MSKGRAVRVFAVNKKRLREAIEAVEVLLEEVKAKLNSGRGA